MLYVKNLTSSQEDKLFDYRDRWMRIGLDTSRTTDKRSAEQWIQNAYTVAGIQAPTKVFWAGSPMACLVAYASLEASIHKVKHDVGHSVGDQIWKLIGDRVLSRVWDRTEERIGDRVRAHFGEEIWDLVGEKTWGRVEDKLRAKTWDPVWNRVGDHVRAQVLIEAWTRVGEQVWDQIWTRVDRQVRDRIGDQTRLLMGSQVRDCVWHQVTTRVEGLARHFVDVGVWNRVGDELGRPVWDQVRTGVCAPIEGQLGDQVWGQIQEPPDRVCSLIDTRVWDQVGNRVLSQVGAHVWDFCRSQISNFSFGQHEADPLGVYEFFWNECDLIGCEKILPLIHIAQQCGWWLPYSDAAIVSEKPVALHLNARGQLHSESGPAVLYRDGWAIWALNGVRVPQYIVETPSYRLNPQTVLRETNVEVRREIVRKVGVERLCEALNATVLDAWGNYELLNLDLRDGRRRPYLKMKNPSIGVFHIEGVAPSCRTVQEALVWRNGTDERPVVLT